MKSLLRLAVACTAFSLANAVISFASTAAKLPTSNATQLQLIIFDYDSLVKTREAIHAGESKLEPAYRRLIQGSDALLSKEPFSVLDKKYVAPSGNKQDYFDIGFYSWPNPNTPDGLPYIRRDGHRNPEANGPEFDKFQFNSTLNRVRQMGLAYFYTGDEKYAAKGAEFLRTWFIDPATRMNPNMNHAASLPGVFDGSFIGIINTVALIDMLDSVKLLGLSESWTNEDDTGLKKWFSEYIDWLTNSDFGKKERGMKNNHGSWYAAQVATYALYVGQPELIGQMVALGRAHIDHQIAKDGSLPEELRRNRSLAYSRYGLQAFSALARAGDFAGHDLWHYKTQDGRGLELAFNFIAPYLAGEKEWTWEQLQENAYGGSVRLLYFPSTVYDSEVITRAVLLLNPLTNPISLQGNNESSQMVWLQGYLPF